MVPCQPRLVARTIRRDAAIDLTASKRRKLLELGRRFGRGRRRYLAAYWHPAHLEAILGPRHKLVEERRRTGWLATDLSAHQNKVCLETTVGLLRSGWQLAIRRAAGVVLCDDSLNGSEKEMALRILRTNRLLQDCLDGSTDEWVDAAARRLRRRLRRIVLRSRGRMPKASRKVWFDLDCNLYRAFGRDPDSHFRGAWLAITGIEPRQRIHVPLAGRRLDEFVSRTRRSTSGPTIRVVVDARVTFYVLGYVQPASREGDVSAGLDKGFNTLMTLSTGDPETSVTYGPKAGALITQIADGAVAAAKQRRRIVAHARSLRNSAPGRAKRIRRRNLGARKSSRRFLRDRATLRQQVGQSLNELFRTQASLTRLHCEDLAFRSSPLSRSLNRRLARWLKGYLHERLTYKAELNGVELSVVNAAYTSQSCPRCWFTSSSNRRGERFKCADCGYAGSADAIAATNVLKRGSDPAITRGTSHGDVKQILEARWRSARNGRAWGSNEAGPARDVVREHAGRQSREQPDSSEVLVRATRRRSIDGVAAACAATERGPADHDDLAFGP
jgi:putative transposase